MPCWPAPSRSRPSACASTRRPGACSPQPARAVVDLPPFASSAMDGFAVRAADTPGRLPVVARIAAGRPAARPLAPGEAMGIATGGVVPEGADAVVPIERVEVLGDDGRVLGGCGARRATCARAAATCRRATSSSRRARGSGQRRSARSRRQVSPRSSARAGPRVAVLTTGTELRRAGRLARARARSTSRTASCCRRCSATAGAIVERSTRSQDDEAAHRAAIERGPRARRARHLGRRLGRAARPRARDRGRARRRGGLLGRVREAGKAARVRCSRAHARLRAPRQPRLVARLERALRPARAARAPG